MHQTDQTNLRIAEIKEQIRDLKSEIETERRRINSLWWKFSILAGVISAVSGKVFGSTIGEIVHVCTGW